LQTDEAQFYWKPQYRSERCLSAFEMRQDKCSTSFLFYPFLVISICMLLYFDLVPTMDLKPKRHDDVCGRFPTEEHITVDNLYWQILAHSKGLVNILNAYLDLRQNQSFVRISVISNVINNSDTFYCQFWFSDTKIPSIVKATDVLKLWGEFKCLLSQQYGITRHFS
jgi:hypothetical protein